jgi:hypothetical protein
MKQTAAKGPSPNGANTPNELLPMCSKRGSKGVEIECSEKVKWQQVDV